MSLTVTYMSLVSVMIFPFGINSLYTICHTVTYFVKFGVGIGERGCRGGVCTGKEKRAK